ncbi:MAG: M1 family metallopeptidase [Chitinophagaceae bacterium]|nr:M1 family metallopeptidase [Chitinophagaceae bacterium]
MNFLLVLLALITAFDASAQSKFNPYELFAAYPKGNVTPYRAANGAPGEAYWQNRVNYILKAKLDTVKNTMTVWEEIEYINNSPDNLSSLWLQLDQNMYKKGSISDYSRGLKRQEYTEGYQFKKISISHNGKVSDPEYIVSDTRMQIRLDELLLSKHTLKITIDYTYEVPGLFGGRTDFFPTKNGKIYEIAQWFPRMCVYDDLNGWNTLPYIGTGEFYCEYGNYDYSITLPDGMMVVGSGEVVNENEVYTAQQLARLNQARSSDKTVFIRDKEEVEHEAANARKNQSKEVKWKTWRFKMENSRDVAFGASLAYIIDAAKINLPAGKKALAMSAYPVESSGEGNWARSTEFLKGSVEHFSDMWMPYPYPVAVNEAGRAGGMEYPGIVFNGMRAKEKDLFWLVAHEIGHVWFPMVIGSNERKDAWIDEGFNTFIDVYASDYFNNGEFAPKRDGEYAPGGGNPADEIIPWIEDPGAPTMMNRADIVTGKYRHPFSYFKPAFGLVLLREQILGTDRFDYAFKKYMENWSYKHPSANDFFRAMENESGEDLSWFWRQWFANNWAFDVAIDSVVTNSKENYATVYLINKEKSAYPLDIQVNYINGKKEQLRLPVEVWYSGNKFSFRLNHSDKIESIAVDSDNRLPDSDRENNKWESQ